jgi:hypothetical protein
MLDAGWRIPIVTVAGESPRETKVAGDAMDLNTFCMVLMGVVAVGGIVQRIVSKKGIGVRFIQFMCIGLGVPALLILAADDKIEKQVLASLIGAVIGYGVAKTGGTD